MRRAFLALFTLSVLIIWPPRADAAPASVTVQNTSYNPSTVTVQQGETVTWTNKDSVAHTATADDGSFDTSPGCDASNSQDESCLKPNEPVSITFNTIGTFAYHCKIHSSMHGTVIVTVGSTTTQPPTTTEPPTSSPAVTSTTPASSSSSSTSSSSSSGTTTTSSSTTTSTSETTTTSSTTTTTTLLSSGSGQVAIADKGTSGGGSSAAPFLIGGAVVVAALAALAYWLWWRSGTPAEEGPDWTQEPPSTTQGPQI